MVKLGVLDSDGVEAPLLPVIRYSLIMIVRFSFILKKYLAL